jgi:nucleoside-diphosphate-sugar epimerase
MKILVTGGSGYIGSHVRDYFNADDFSRRSGRDVLNMQDTQIVADYDVVIHLAAEVDKAAENSESIFLTNVEGTVNLLRAMRSGAVFIYASTKDVYGRFADNYAEVSETCSTLYSGQTPLEWSKLIAERYVEYFAHQNDFRSCIFRLSTTYVKNTPGNVANFVGGYAEAINTGERLRLPGNGLPRRDLLHARDFALACEAFRDSVIRHGLYNLGGGLKNAATLRELVAKLEEVSELQAIIDDENPLPAPVPMHYVSDLSLVRQELGWEPTISLEDGLITLFH